MALQFQLVPIEISGLNTATDPRKLNPGELTVCENIVYTEPGSTNVRNGYQKFGNQVFETGAFITNGEALSTFKNELLQFDGTDVYGKLNATDGFTHRGKAISIDQENINLVRNSHQQLYPDCAQASGLLFVAYEDDDATIHYQVSDIETNTIIVANKSLGSDGENPRIIAFENNQILIFYVNGNTLNYRVIAVTQPATVGNEVQVANNCNSFYDAQHIGNRCFVSYSDTNNLTSSLYLNATLNTSPTVTNTENAKSIIHMIGDSSNNCWVFRSDGYSKLDYFIRSYELNTVLANTTIDNSSITYGNIVGIIEPSSTTTAKIFYQVDQLSLGSSNSYIEAATATLAGGVTKLGVLKRSVGLASRPFIFNNLIYLNIVHSSSLQSTYFLMDETGRLVAKTLAGLAGGIHFNNIFSSVLNISTGVFYYVNAIKGHLESQNGNVFSLLGVNLTIHDFNIVTRYQTCTAGDNLILAGALVQSYDGYNFREHGYNLYPEQITTSLDGYAGSIAAGQYQYLVVYEHSDNGGGVQESNPSEIVTRTRSTTGSITVHGPTLRLTDKDKVRIGIYRTENVGTTFYKVTDVINPLLNDPTVDTWYFIDTLSDSDLIADQIVYTTGLPEDEVGNIAPPACKYCITNHNRVWLGGLDDPQSLWFSKEITTGLPAEFNDTFNIRVNDQFGKVTGLGSMDNNLIIFTERGIYKIVGDGPDATGQTNFYQPPTFLTSDAGCINANSITTTDNGLFFQSKKGIYLLQRNEQPTYKGLPVDKYNKLNITSSVLLSNKNEVRFCSDDSKGICLVYNYIFDKWSIFTNYQAADGVLFQDEFTLLRSNGRVYQENDGFVDDTDPIKFKLTTGWLYPTNPIQGWSSVRDIMILGTYKGSHKLLCKFAYDFVDFFTQETLIEPDADFSETYGDGYTYGDKELFGGTSFPVYQYDIHQTTHKCQAIMISIEVVQVKDFNEGFSLSGLTIEVGGKRGVFKLPSGRQLGNQ